MQLQPLRTLCALITAQIQALWLAWSSDLAFSLQSLHYENVRFLELFPYNSSSSLSWKRVRPFLSQFTWLAFSTSVGCQELPPHDTLQNERISCWNLTPRLFTCLSAPLLLLRVGFDKQKDTAAVITALWGCLGHCGNTVISQSVFGEQILRGKDGGAVTVACGICCDLSLQILTRFPHLLMLCPTC